MHDDIDWEQHISRIPRWDDAFKISLRLLCGEHAPPWTAHVGDRRTDEDESFVNDFGLTLRQPWERVDGVPEHIRDWVRKRCRDTAWFRENLVDKNLSDWENLPMMSREDLSLRLARVIPETADLSRLIVNPTTGTTGSPLPCPNHPRAIGCYDAIFEYVMELWGIPLRLEPGLTLAVQVCYQASTLTYATCHSRHKGAGFAKVNIHPSVWPTDEVRAWLNRVRPQILTGDPWSFDRMIRLGLRPQPRALLSTSLTLEEEQLHRWEDWFGCPVIDLYSMNETGPLGVTLPGNPGVFHQLARDLYLEASADGELLVSGGRNPYLPLFRYRTGDRITFVPGTGGRPAWRLISGRTLTVWQKADGSETQPLEIARILRSYREVINYQVYEARPHLLRIWLEAPAMLPEVRQELAERLASFWEGNLSAGSVGRQVSYPPPKGHVRIEWE